MRTTLTKMQLTFHQDSDIHLLMKQKKVAKTLENFPKLKVHKLNFPKLKVHTDVQMRVDKV